MQALLALRGKAWQRCTIWIQHELTSASASNVPATALPFHDTLEFPAVREH